MDGSITCRFRWNFDEFVKAHKTYRKHSPVVRKARLWSAGISIVVLAIGSIRIMNLGWNLLSAWFFFFSGMLLLLQFPPWRRRMLEQTYSKMIERDVDVHWEILNDRIAISTPCTSLELLLPIISQVICSNEGFLVFSHPTVFHWLPRHAFQSASDAEQFAQLAQSKVRSYLDRR